MRDIVDRLLLTANNDGHNSLVRSARDAADEIERLREALTEISQTKEASGFMTRDEMASLAMTALKQE